MKLAEKILLNLKRLLAWIFWIIVTLLFVELLLQIRKLTTNSCPGLTNISFDFDSALDTAICYLKLYSITIIITIANLLVPIIFSFIVNYEDYSPKTRLIVDLLRSIVFRLTGLVVIMVDYIGDNK